MARWFLKVYASCDGGITVSKGVKGTSRFYVRRVVFTSKNKNLRIELSRLLESLGYIPHDDGEKHVYITGNRDLKKYAEEIAFLEGVKVTGNSRRFKGLEKNRVLKLVIKSYEDPSILDPFF